MRMMAMPVTVFYADPNIGFAVRYHGALDFAWLLMFAQSVAWLAVTFLSTIIAQVIVVIMVLMLLGLRFHQESKSQTVIFRKETFHV